MKKIYFALFAILIIAGCQDKKEKVLPIFGEKKVEGTDTIYYTISDFSFTNQEGETLSREDLKGKVYVTDFFFTTCPTICPVMKKQMLRVYNEYEGDEDFKIVSHTIDPKHDNVQRLHKYANKLGIEDAEQWHFVTGEKDSIFDIATKYMVAVAEDPKAAGGLVHSGAFMLIDRQGRIRGHYDGTKAEEVDVLIEDIEILLDE